MAQLLPLTTVSSFPFNYSSLQPILILVNKKNTWLSPLQVVMTGKVFENGASYEKKIPKRIQSSGKSGYFNRLG